MKMACGFPVSRISMVLSSSSSPQQLRDLLGWNHDAYLSDDLLITHPAPLESRRLGEEEAMCPYLISRAPCGWQLQESFQETGF